jgi:glycopeptide antibiotics resistance protein
MQRSSIHIATLIIVLSILTAITQYGAYYFLSKAIIVFGITTVVILLCSHLLLEHTLSYESCFSYALLNIFINFVIILLSYYGNTEGFLPFNPILYLFILINILIPILYCITRYLFDRGPKFSNFLSFYRNISIIFLGIYLGVLIYLLFINNESMVLYYSNFENVNLIPFLTMATLIEDYVDGFVTIGSILNYLLLSTLLFVPFGFYGIMLLRNSNRLIRFMLLILFPVIIEVLQKTFLLGKGDIDDVILGLIGGLVGGLFYHILNSIFRFVKDEDFLNKGSRYSFYRSSLHF